MPVTVSDYNFRSEDSDEAQVSRAGSAPGRVAGSELLKVEDVKIGYVVEGVYNPAVGSASFNIWEGESVMLLGPSGCGKSTLLKAISGFLEPQHGTIEFAGSSDLEPGPDRAVVFQEFDQLFPWHTVKENVAYPLRMNGRSKKEAQEIAVRYVEMMGLTPAADRYPHRLSGGMKQRVAIARAFALDPKMLLMDEPFGSLDAQTRSRLQGELRDIVKRTGVTVLFVTHSIQEAIVLGTRVVVLSEPPSVVADVVDVENIDDPDSEAFIGVRRKLRELLAGDEGKGQDHGVFE